MSKDQDDIEMLFAALFAEFNHLAGVEWCVREEMDGVLIDLLIHDPGGGALTLRLIGMRLNGEPSPKACRLAREIDAAFRGGKS